MERSTRDTFAALLLGGGLSGVLYWTGGYLALALVTGVCWGCGLKLTLHVGDSYPAYATGETWADERWTGLSVGLVSLAAFVGVSPTLPVSAALRFGLGILVVGAGFLAYAAGTLAVLERVADGSNATRSSAGASYPAGDD